jgi:hypothetical protein
VAQERSGNLVLAFVVTVVAIYAPHVLALFFDEHLGGLCSDCRANWIRKLVILPGFLPSSLAGIGYARFIGPDKYEFVQATLSGFFCAGWITVGTLVGGWSRAALVYSGIACLLLACVSAFVLTRMWAA